jgi:hypothetical protein
MSRYGHFGKDAALSARSAPSAPTLTVSRSQGPRDGYRKSIEKLCVPGLSASWNPIPRLVHDIPIHSQYRDMHLLCTTLGLPDAGKAGRPSSCHVVLD